MVFCAVVNDIISLDVISNHKWIVSSTNKGYWRAISRNTYFLHMTIMVQSKIQLIQWLPWIKCVIFGEKTKPLVGPRII